jgi:hypothetical protein
MSVPKLPPGWRVENFGLIEAIEFSHPDRTFKLLWCDRQWSMVYGAKAMPASGVPSGQDNGRGAQGRHRVDHSC